MKGKLERKRKGGGRGGGGKELIYDFDLDCLVHLGVEYIRHIPQVNFVSPGHLEKVLLALTNWIALCVY